MEDWLKQLDTRMLVEKVGPLNISRVEQLFNKTNQLNLSTRRLSADEILAWASKAGRDMLAISVSDKFGDMGLTGILSIEYRFGEEAELVDYILSCRVMGRNVEEAMIKLAVDITSRLSARRLIGTFLPTERNSPTLKVLKACGLTWSTNHQFSWDCAHPFPNPESLLIEFLSPMDL
jgi:FkbH-like protein